MIMLRMLDLIYIFCVILEFSVVIISPTGPHYLYSLMSHYQPTRSLRSVNQHLLFKQISSSVNGNRAFRVAAAIIWNILPIEV